MLVSNFGFSHRFAFLCLNLIVFVHLNLSSAGSFSLEACRVWLLRKSKPVSELESHNPVPNNPDFKQPRE